MQGLPSSQGRELKAWVQLPEALQASVVQGLPSSQFSGVPLRQRPLLHTSPTVQALPSEQEGPVRGRPTQPTKRRHSEATQAVEGGHAELSGIERQPPPGFSIQKSLVQGMPSLQFRGLPPTQLPPEQDSPTVQKRPSEQLPPSGVWMHPPAGASQASWVHGF